MSAKKDLTGKRFGKLRILMEAAPRVGHGHAMWLALCSCGALTEVQGGNLRSGHTTSCGHRVDRSAEPPPSRRNARWIALGGSKFVLVDASEFPRLSERRWHVTNGYAARSGSRGKCFYMHHAILAQRKGTTVDHKNRNTFDNRRSNLRYAPDFGQSANTRKRRSALTRLTSRFKGVSWNTRDRRWAARVKRQRLGMFLVEREAARAYDVAAKKLFGRFARTNKMLGLL